MDVVSTTSDQLLLSFIATIKTWDFPFLYSFSFRYLLRIRCISFDIARTDWIGFLLKRSRTFLMFDVVEMQRNRLLADRSALLSSFLNLRNVVYTRVRRVTWIIMGHGVIHVDEQEKTLSSHEWAWTWIKTERLFGSRKLFGHVIYRRYEPWCVTNYGELLQIYLNIEIGLFDFSIFHEDF